MTMIIQDPLGSDVEIPVIDRGGQIEFAIRGPSRAALEAAMLSQLMLVQEEVDGETVIRPAAGVHISWIGQIVMSPATYDEEGVELTAPVLTPQYHANVLVGPIAMNKVDETGYPNWMNTALLWMENGIEDTPNKAEEALILNGVSLIDMTTVSSPTRVWM